MKAYLLGLVFAAVSTTALASDYSVAIGGGYFGYDVDMHSAVGVGKSFQFTKQYSSFSAGVAIDQINGTVGVNIPTTLEYWSLLGLAQFERPLFNLPTYFSAGLGVFADSKGTSYYTDLTPVYGGPLDGLVRYSNKEIKTSYYQAMLGAGMKFNLTPALSLKLDADVRYFGEQSAAMFAKALIAFDF